MWQVLQSATDITNCDRILSQSATGITKCDNYNKVRRNTVSQFKKESVNQIYLYDMVLYDIVCKKDRKCYGNLKRADSLFWVLAKLVLIFHWNTFEKKFTNLRYCSEITTWQNSV